MSTVSHVQSTIENNDAIHLGELARARVHGLAGIASATSCTLGPKGRGAGAVVAYDEMVNAVYTDLSVCDGSSRRPHGFNPPYQGKH